MSITLFSFMKSRPDGLVANSATGKGLFMVGAHAHCTSPYYTGIVNSQAIAICSGHVDMALGKPGDCTCLNHSTLLDKVKSAL